MGDTTRGGGPKTPVREGRDPRTLASRRHWLPQVVVATTCSCIQRNAWSPVVTPCASVYGALRGLYMAASSPVLDFAISEPTVPPSAG